MEAIFAPSSADQSLSPYKKKNHRGFSSVANENLVARNYDKVVNGGCLLFAPPPYSLSFSCPPVTSHSFLNPTPYQQLLHNNHRHQPPQPPQPPLLPLPILKPYQSLPPPPRSRSLSCPSKKNKKPKQPTKKREQKPVTELSLPLGPDPNDLPKDVKVLSPTSSMAKTDDINNITSFSGCVFTLSPPPSSLPLPKFSIRPKLSCTAEAAGVDDGATDNLRRLLRLP